MFFIKPENGATVTSQNHPADDILGGLINHWGEDIRVARLKTRVDFAAYQAIPNPVAEVDFDAATVEVYKREAIAPAEPQDPEAPPAPPELGEPVLVRTFDLEVLDVAAWVEAQNAPAPAAE
ncbi:hypothetical protein D3C72_852590 [compost metagenome]